MAKCCGGASGACGCALEQGTGITISGDGGVDNPYIISSDSVSTMRGAVDPEGAVVGSPGDVYASTDVAATLGRRLWFKASGVATNTGWVLLEGDTGWRNISALLLNGWDGTLAIRAKIEDRKPQSGGYLLHEYGIGDFERTFEVSEAVNADGIHAELQDGVLTIHLPKTKAAKSHKIAVSTG